MMGIWLMMFAFNLVIPAVMIFAGWMMEKHRPKEINWIIGYRTELSMKNMDTWHFANAHCGRMWQRVGRIMAASALLLLPLLRCSEEVIGIVGTVIMLVQCAALIASIFPTEQALGKRFHADGARKIFHRFKNQQERRDFGGSCFLEMQYCRLEKGTSIEQIVSADAMKHWQDDSLYIDGDNTDALQLHYGDIFIGGTYNNLEIGRLDIWGINYYSAEQVEKIVEKIRQKKPLEWETVLEWIQKAKEHNGIYILGV